MKKTVLFILTVIFLKLSVFAQVPSAKCTLSDNVVSPGGTFVVTVDINKCDLACYAQFQQLLPEGFAATEITGESDNANFYFENGKVFYQWYKLPVERGSIRLKYNVSVSGGVKTGKYEIPGYFSYQMKNRLAQIDTPSTITIK